MCSKAEWLQFADRVYEKGKAILEQSHEPEGAEGAHGPNVVALALLARTMSNFQSSILLLENRFIVEARTIVRCCYENLFWIGALAKSGDEFIKKMELDHVCSRQKRANSLLEWSKSQDSDLAVGLEEFCMTLQAEYETSDYIRQINAATKAGLKDAYIIYRELSSDAAHPSLDSLNRHVTWPEGIENARFTMHAHPIPDVESVEYTLELACSSTLSVCVAADEILGGVEAGERTKNLVDDFSTLSRDNSV